MSDAVKKSHNQPSAAAGVQTGTSSGTSGSPCMPDVNRMMASISDMRQHTQLAQVVLGCFESSCGTVPTSVGARATNCWCWWKWSKPISECHVSFSAVISPIQKVNVFWGLLNCDTDDPKMGCRCSAGMNFRLNTSCGVLAQKPWPS